MPRSESYHGIGFKLLGFAVIVGAFGCQPKQENKTAAAPPPPVVEVGDIIRRDQPIYEEWVGTLDGFVNAQIRAQVSGYLLRQDYADGAKVKKGDLLFEIDPRTFQSAFNQAKASFDKTELDLQRAKKLLEENSMSKQERDNALQAHAIAQAALDQAQLNLEFTRIVSPIDGVAGVATAQIGDLVGPSTGVLTTVSTVDPIKAYFAISEQSYLEFQHPRPGQPKFPDELQLELVLADGSVYPQKGKFFSADRQIDPTTGTLRVVGTFPNPDNLLRPGQYARVRAAVRTLPGALLVPQRAVSELQGAYQVATVDGQNKAHIKTVKVGDRVGSLWIVTEGLQPDDRVIVGGAQKVRDGMTVNPQELARITPGGSAPAKK